jgi:hypothetical protein
MLQFEIRDDFIYKLVRGDDNNYDRRSSHRWIRYNLKKKLEILSYFKFLLPMSPA